MTFPLHVLAIMVIVLGAALGGAPSRAASALSRPRPVWTRVAGSLLAALGAYALFATHITFFW
jgi:hypothetical protein